MDEQGDLGALGACYHDRSLDRAVSYRVRWLPAGLGASLVAGIVSGLLGVGGGILIVPFLIFVCKYPVKHSAGAAAYVVVFSSLFGVIGHSAVGQLDTGLIAVTAVAVLVGAVLGASFMTRTKSKTIKAGFGLVMLVFAIQLVLKLAGVV